MKVAPNLYPGLPKKEQSVIRSYTELGKHLHIISVVAKTLFVDPVQMTSPSRKKEVSEARIIAIRMLLNLPNEPTLKQIGQLLGGRDHSTISYGRDLYDDLYGTNKSFTLKANAVLKNL